MKNKIFGYFLVLILLQSCSKDKAELQIPTYDKDSFTCLDMNDSDIISNDCIDNWDCNFKITPQSKVDINENQGLTSGDKNVFQMINRTEGNLGIADDEFTNILVFELDESLDSFSVEDNEMKNMQVYFKRICYCSNVAFNAITSGCLQGQKQSDGTWFIQGKLMVSSLDDFDIKFDAQFVN